MDSERIERWREADRLFALWLERAADERESWLAGERIDATVLHALRRLIERHAGADAALPVLDLSRRPEDPAPPNRNALAGRRVGVWKLLEEIGRGGMSVVYRARRTGVDFEQVAAVKLLGLAAMSAHGSARFDQERRILARLRHPQIATLIDGGFAEDGTPYLAMALVDGNTLGEYCDARQLDWRQRVELVRGVCDAVAHAHRNLLVHRDLKPSNILVTAEGMPILIDFGIAKLLDEGGGHTEAGMRALTPGYAAPEQLTDGTITTATDVHALGIILRELCVETSGVPGDLHNIVAMATREDAERRYPDARALGDDLDRLLGQRPVRATADSAGYRLRAFLRRRKGLAIAAGAVAIAVIAGVAATVWQARRTALQATEALHQAARAQTARDFLFSLFASGDRERSDEHDLSVSTLIARGIVRLEERVGDDLELDAEMALLLGHLDTTIGGYARAARLLEDALASAERAGAPELIAQARARQGILANALGLPAQAVVLFDAAAVAAANTPDGGLSIRVETASGRAYAMANTGRGGEAREQLNALLGDPRKTLRPPQRGELQLALATVTDDPPARLLVLREAQAQFALEGAPPATRMALLSELARSLAQSGGVAEAVAHSREAAALADRMNPGATSRRARARNNLGSILAKAHLYAEANTAYASAEAIHRQLGDEHSPAFTALLHNRGVLLRDLAAPELGLPLIEEALARARSNFGEDDARSVMALRNLALCRAEAGPDARADDEWRTAWAKAAKMSVRSRHDFLVVGATIALRLDHPDVAMQRLAEADALATAEALALSPVQQMRAATLRGSALSLDRQSTAAEAQFQAARELSNAAGADGWATTWRNALASAEHAQRQGDAATATAHFADALHHLQSNGSIPESALLQRLRGLVAGAAAAGVP